MIPGLSLPSLETPTISIVWHLMAGQSKPVLFMEECPNPRKVSFIYEYPSRIPKSSCFQSPGANPEYTMATGLAVTFMVTNREDKSQLVEAMEWEKK